MKKHKAIIFCSIVILLSTFHFLLSSVFAFESTSTSFEIHAGAIDSVAGSSTSASFKNISAGGQLATGSSTVSGGSASKLFSGILYWLAGFFTPSFDQIHYRWRNDDGSESEATWSANEDTQILNVSKNAIKRLRFEISNEGWRTGSSQQFRIEYASTTICSAGIYTAIPVIAATEHWQMATSTYLTDGVATTNVASGLIDENANFVAGQVKTTGNITSAITLTSRDFTEIEYAILATSTANNGGTYCFRLTNNGATTNFNYSKYPIAVLGGGYLAIGELTSVVFDSGVTDGVAYNSVMWKGVLGSPSQNQGKVRIKIATSNSDVGPWDYRGPEGGGCSTLIVGDSNWYVANPNTPLEIGCFDYHNNKKYFRYKVQICSSSDCSTPGNYTPEVQDVVMSWSP